EVQEAMQNGESPVPDRPEIRGAKVDRVARFGMGARQVPSASHRVVIRHGCFDRPPFTWKCGRMPEKELLMGFAAPISILLIGIVVVHGKVVGDQSIRSTYGSFLLGIAIVFRALRVIPKRDFEVVFA
ncbi:MAG TPA: hypothetical protein VFC51_14830, partial [Chloroflexota bacterium]|nr:hypothetical protein [Chloroflexota bacterium]